MAEYTCPKCGLTIRGDIVLPVRCCEVSRPTSKPTAEWPTWARTIARFRKPEDVGIGDTFHRIAERFGAERVIKALKINCGCQVRRENWNAEYSYDGDTR